jgi:hypothetical protein
MLQVVMVLQWGVQTCLLLLLLLLPCCWLGRGLLLQAVGQDVWPWLVTCVYTAEGSNTKPP